MSQLARFDAGTARLPMPWASYDALEYDDALRGAEYMDGELLLAPGLPDWGHQAAIDHLRERIRPGLGEDEHVVTGFGWKPDRVLEEYGPDVMVCTTPADRRRFTGLPLLCVEVTSTNRVTDTVLKLAKYAAAGLGDYWIVDRQDQALRCYKLREGVFIETDVLHLKLHHGEAILAFYAGRGVELELDQLFL